MPNTPTATYTLDKVLLSLQGVSKRYGNTQVLRSVTRDIFDVRRTDRTDIKQGQVVGLLGPSGVGKSTLLKIIAGLEAPDEGQVLIGPKQTPTRTGQVGAVFQNYPLYEDRLVIDNLIYGGLRGGLSPAEAKKKAVEMLERFGLAARAKAYPIELSGGQRQRAAIAQQLLCSNHLLILDEPFSGLDPNVMREASKIILETSVIDEEMTILIITHDIHECLKVSDEVWMMGRDHDAQGNIVPGAYIKLVYDLKAMGLAWDPELTHRPECAEFERKVRDEFKNL